MNVKCVFVFVGSHVCKLMCDHMLARLRVCVFGLLVSAMSDVSVNDVVCRCQDKPLSTALWMQRLHHVSLFPQSLLLVQLSLSAPG